MTSFKKRSLVIIILSSTLFFTSASQAREAKIDTLNPFTVDQSDMSATIIENNEAVEVVNASQSITSEEEQKVDENNYETYSVTAFTSGYESTQKKKGQKGYGVTASGNQVQEGITAACPKSMSFGTEIYIKELDHTYICHDRGSRITEGHIDIYFDDLKEARQFGRQKLSVAIID
ncbi:MULTISPECIES: 3D domain-containing protein [unclassified Paenibacillus]|uniref:3D domain-containing protein n=1 Tax=unclassified Paenibacillus TaxID=185978 RepID=UPI00363C0C94